MFIKLKDRYVNVDEICSIIRHSEDHYEIETANGNHFVDKKIFEGILSLLDVKEAG